MRRISPLSPFAVVLYTSSPPYASTKIKWQKKIITKCSASTATLGRRHQEGLSQARDETPSGPQSGQSQGRRAIQGSQGSLRSPDRRQQARGLRSVRPRRRRSVRRRRAPARASAASPMPSATSSATSSAAAARALERLSRRRPALQPRDLARGSRARHRDQDPHSRAWRNARPAMAPAPSPARSPPPAPTCSGHGQVRMQQGFFSIQQTCPRCHGTRQDRARPLRAPASGAGRVKQHKTLSVKIPAGVDEGDRIRLSGEGEAGVNGGPPGDLYVVIHLKPHAVFQRDHNDLHCEMPISFTTAALGGEIEIPTLDGYAKIKVPAETQTGKVFRLRGKGIKGVRSHAHGDLLCHVVVETPVNLTRAPERTAAGARIDQRRRRRPPQPARQVLDGQGQGVLRLSGSRDVSTMESGPVDCPRFSCLRIHAVTCGARSSPRALLEHDAGGEQLVADAIGFGEIPSSLRAAARARSFLRSACRRSSRAGRSPLQEFAAARAAASPARRRATSAVRLRASGRDCDSPHWPDRTARRRPPAC